MMLCLFYFLTVKAAKAKTKNENNGYFLMVFNCCLKKTLACCSVAVGDMFLNYNEHGSFCLF